MMIEEKLDNIVRYSKKIFENSNFYDLEYLELFNLNNIKREKHHVCYIREYLNDDKYFKEQMSVFEILKSDDIAEINIKCVDCTDKCIYTVDIFFNYMMLFFVINIHNREFFLNLKEKNALAVKFFKHFKIINRQFRFKLEEYLKLLADYDLKYYNYLLSKNSTLNNLKYLNESQDYIDTFVIRLNNINNDIRKSNLPISTFIKKKNKYFKNKHFIESELKKPHNKDGTDGPTDKIPFNFQNNFDDVNSNKIYNYFKDSLVEKKYLSKETLKEFIILAFQEKTKPTQKYSFSKPKIGKIRTIFYTYYKDVASKPHGKKQEYAELLGNYFKGFTTEKVMNNFANGY